MSIVLDRPTDTAPSLYPNVSFEEYLSWPFCSQSILTMIRDSSPAHAYDQMKNPSPSSDAQVIGDATHAAILQPDRFEDEYLRGPDGPWNRNPYKADVAEMREENPGKVVLKAADFDKCLLMRDAVHSHPMASKLLTEEVEMSAVWQDQSTGVICKARFDCVNRAKAALIDVKTTRDASPRGFKKAVGTYGYYLQSGLYNQGAHALEINPNHFIFIAIENESPSKEKVAVYRITDKSMMAAEHELGHLMQIYKECMDTGDWYGYSGDIEDIDVPGWVIDNIETKLGVELI